MVDRLTLRLSRVALHVGLMSRRGIGISGVGAVCSAKARRTRRGSSKSNQFTPRRPPSALRHSAHFNYAQPLPPSTLPTMAPPPAPAADDPTLLPSDSEDEDFTINDADEDSSSDSEDDEPKAKRAKVEEKVEPVSVQPQLRHRLGRLLIEMVRRVQQDEQGGS